MEIVNTKFVRPILFLNRKNEPYLMMAEQYENFMIFGLESTGEKVKLNIFEEEFRANNGKNVLDPNQVLVIVKEDLRRIYIWKGVNAHVRKKFIASRIAAELQNDLVINGHLHRCKIISVDQGDEPSEFMRVFGLTTTKVPELLERDSEEFKKLHAAPLKGSAETKEQKVHKWSGPPPMLNDTVNSQVIAENVDKEISPKHYQTIKPAKLDVNRLIEKIVNNKVPSDFKRQNLILGNFQIYGAAVKKTKVFGKEVEEIEWEPVSSIPEGPIELIDRTLRLYVNGNSGNIEGIEILQKLGTPEIEESIRGKKEKINYNSWTVNKLKLYCKENNITVPASYKKAQIINLILDSPPQEFTEHSLDYKNWTVKQLIEYCKQNEIKVLTSYRKADLVKLVIEHNK